MKLVTLTYAVWIGVVILFCLTGDRLSLAATLTMTVLTGLVMIRHIDMGVKRAAHTFQKASDETPPH